MYTYKKILAFISSDIICLGGGVCSSIVVELLCCRLEGRGFETQ
jgi:hypothetical protein